MQVMILLILTGQILSNPNISTGLNRIELVPKEQEDETLIHDKISIGGFGGPVVKFSTLNNDFACLVGGKGGLIINHAFIIGGGGYGLTNEIHIHSNNPPRDQYLGFGYGGVLFEFVLRSHKLLHLSIHSLIGGGGADFHTYNDYYLDSDAFFVFEPGADLELNITPHFRMGFGGSYRLVNGIDLTGLSDNVMSGASGNLTFKFGHF